FIIFCRFKDVRRNLQKGIGESHIWSDIFVLSTRGELLNFVHHYPIHGGDAPDVAKHCKTLEELRSCLESNQKTYTAANTNLIVLFQQYSYLHDLQENLAVALPTKDAVLRSVF
uniref:protein-tyrosine-phosphatase n=1 Tax=Dromaius novaehollandiae TaxID=8790 RepID=A0A8C4KFE7_DRONO